jgi:hypothetical protein
MDKLLIVLGFSAGDAMQAERLLDYIAILNQKQPRGHCLLVAAPDTHAETQTKIKIAAEVAFESVELLAVPWPAVAHTSKVEAVNYLFHSAMSHAARCYQWPALWLEPDCTVLKASWLDELAEAYWNQPKRYLGSILSSADGKTRSLSRVAIYPRGAGGELKEFCAGKVPFEMSAASMIVPRAEKTKLFQQLAFTAETDRKLIRDNAVLLHHDKQAVLLSALIDEATKRPAISLEPTGIVRDNHLTKFTIDNTDPCAMDKRTKEYKQWKAAQPANAQT